MLQIPMLLDLREAYQAIAPELQAALRAHCGQSPQCFEIVGEDWGGAHALALPAEGCSLAALLRTSPFAPSSDCLLPSHRELLCLNQILHRTPNPNDLLRPLCGFSFVCVVELQKAARNPYPAQTAGVFAYGSDEGSVYELLQSCYYEILARFESRGVFCLLARV
ncbi:MAG: hypothetical protein HDT11_03560 [Helicobacter sp.]|nr:hypothetical protein [Helicobacter sp.]MBD5167955.1 hypothetical protein [Helicobacter sp.]MDE7195608.1 hypothetical protein [Helicobacter sp.]